MIRRLGPLALAGAVFGGLVAALALTCIRWNAGHFIYLIDDSYTHMAMARSLATSGVYGLSPAHPGTMSSSPLWVVLLASAYRVVGVRDTLPLILNVIAGVTVLAILDRVWRLRVIPAATRTVALIAAILVIPLPGVALLGMEHSAHIAAALGLVVMLAQAIERCASWPCDAAIAAVACLACGLRYESAFLCAPALVMLLAARRWRTGAALAVGGAAPVVLHGIYAHAIGWPLLPSPLSLAWTPTEFTTFFGWIHDVGGRGLAALWHALPLLLLVCGNVMGVLVRKRPIADWRGDEYVAVLAVSATVIQSQCGAFGGSIDRYDAWLAALNLAALVPMLPSLTTAWERLAAPTLGSHVLLRASSAVTAALLLWPLAGRASSAYTMTPEFSHLTWLQQAQMARFCDTYLRGGAVVVNDIGVVADRGGVDVVDIAGLGTVDVARAYLAGDLTSDVIDSVAGRAHADVAILPAPWLVDRLPPTWTAVATWRMLCTSDNVGHWIRDCTYGLLGAEPTTTFYATNAAARDELTRDLRAFEPHLPAAVMTEWVVR